MRPKDQGLAQQLDLGLRAFARERRQLPGIQLLPNREAFIEQLVESVRRVKYISVIRRLELSSLRTDPSSELFDPLKAAVLHARQGQTDEAFWLVFLSVHFGKNIRTGWRLARDVYGRLGDERHWDWVQTSRHPESFRQWLAANETTLRGGDGVPRRFGNHRKRESLDATSPNGTAAVIESYVRWVHPPRTHEVLIHEAHQDVGENPREVFDYLYRSMRVVRRFGRLARFDYLTMLGKLCLAPIEPGSTYMEGATGPLRGARLLFGGDIDVTFTTSSLDEWLVQLDAALRVGMQVLEDALCNWQKSPGYVDPFRG